MTFVSRDSIVQMKIAGNFNRICRNGAEDLVPLLKETFKYTYTEKPNYKKLRNMLTDLIRINSEEEMIRTSNSDVESIDGDEPESDSENSCDLDQSSNEEFINGDNVAKKLTNSSLHGFDMLNMPRRLVSLPKGNLPYFDDNL